jgi:hypothetical protein
MDLLRRSKLTSKQKGIYGPKVEQIEVPPTDSNHTMPRNNSYCLRKRCTEVVREVLTLAVYMWWPFAQ